MMGSCLSWCYNVCVCCLFWDHGWDWILTRDLQTCCRLAIKLQLLNTKQFKQRCSHLGVQYAFIATSCCC